MGRCGSIWKRGLKIIGSFCIRANKREARVEALTELKSKQYGVHKR